MDLWDENAKILRCIGNIVATDISKCDAVLNAGLSLPGTSSWMKFYSLNLRNFVFLC